MTTNKTTYYDLPQWVPTDEVSILDDFNGAFADIDTGIHEAKAVADSANTSASNAASNASTALGIGNDNQSDITALQSVQTTQGNAVNTLTGVVNGHTTTIGGINTKLGTTDISSIGDGTVTGAIIELSGGSGENKVLAWTNPAPTSPMVGGQITLDVPFVNAVAYEVEYTTDTGNTSLLTTGRLNDITKSNPMIAFYDKMMYRSINRVNNTTFSVASGTIANTYGSAVGDATKCIPVRIWYYTA